MISFLSTINIAACDDQVMKPFFPSPSASFIGFNLSISLGFVASCIPVPVETPDVLAPLCAEYSASEEEPDVMFE